MTGRLENENGPGLLADHLAELQLRFRHFSGENRPSGALASSMARMRITARLLPVLAQPAGRATEGFQRLGGVLAEWVHGFESSPESFPVYLEKPVGRLADYLEELIARRDDGVPAIELAKDQGWPGVLASFRHAGTPLAVMEDADELFRRWRARWTENNLTPAQVKLLQRRWLDLRKSADQLFLGEGRKQLWGRDPEEPSAGRPRILLLVDSNFGRNQLRGILVGRNFEVVVPSDPSEGRDLLAAGPGFRAAICDNLEPTRHLVRLRKELQSLPSLRSLPLVLVVAGPFRSRGPLRDRARALGAAAAWSEPYDPAELSGILQRLSQP